MPSRGPRPSLVRTHSRSSSGGSSKLVYNLQLTHKDPVVQSKIDKARRTSHTFEPNPRVNVSRTGSTVLVQAREQSTAPAPRRSTHLQPPRGGRPKAGFTIASSTVGSDEDDEWVSSESGAATPMGDASGDEGPGKKTPQEVSPATPVDLVGQQVKGENPALVPGTTPHAEPTQPRPRVQTNGFAPTRPAHAIAPPTRLSDLSEHPQYPQQEWDPYHQQSKSIHPQPDTTQQTPLPKSRQPPISSHIPDHIVSSTSLVHTPESPVVGGVRTEPPTPTSPRSEHYSTGRLRPSSTRSLIADHALRPHPLIRGQSFGHGHLAPLKVSSDAAQAQLSSSPPPGRSVSTSPPSIRTISTPIQSASPGRQFSSSIFRRPSTSSAHSAATLPVQPRTPIERKRTMSTLSATSSSAALSSLSHLPTRGAVATPQNAPLVVHFPPQSAHTHPDTVHALLPPPYVTPHFTVLQWRSPIFESNERVARARESQRRRRGP
ncbi:hypothetical protein BGY98DRAFT_1096195 [Russula aff. rugulosa BPL654]|nr:hypothetical protein BGY98DRAFT_1096195 [Russula aff. rugulosa BPL654]